MARVATIQTNFSGGELSPRMKGRVDQAKYFNGTSSMLNYVILSEGGARRRGGLRFVREVKDSTKDTRLIPFIFSRAQSYMLEFGHQVMRVFKDGGIVETSPGVPYELALPYASTEVFDVKYTQLGDTMYLFHPSYPTRQLVRKGHADWKIVVVPWQVEPMAEQGIKPVATLTPAATTGAGVNFTASVASFLASDVGRQLVSGNGVATITGFTSTTIVVCTIIDAFASTAAIPSQSWTLTISPVTACTPSGKGLGETITLTLAANGWRAGDVGSYVRINDGTVLITVFTSDLIVSGVVKSDLLVTTLASGGAWTLEQKVWNSTNGYPRAGTIFEQRLYAAGSTQYPQTIWGSKTGQFLNHAPGADASDAVSFTIASNEVNQIEHLASESDLLPLTYGGEFRMSGSNDAPIQPANVRIKSQSAWGCAIVRPLRVGTDVLYVNRSGKKLRAAAYNFGADKYVSSNITKFAKHITGDGIVDMAYQQDPEPFIWSVRADGYFLSTAFDREEEMLGWARCNTSGTAKSVATIPYAGIDQTWFVVRRIIGGVAKRYVEYLDDTLNTDSAVTGSVGSTAVTEVTWTGGLITVYQVAHGYATGDRVKLEDFVSVLGDEELDSYNVTRTITVTDANHYTMTLADDPGVMTTAGVARKGVTAWSGLTHLNGRTVNVVADGARLTDNVVAAGAITIERPGFDVEIGLNYKASLTLLPIESQAFGTAQGRQVSVYEVVVRLLESSGLQIDGKEVEFKQHGTDVLDNPNPLFTGDKTLEKVIWEKSGGAITLSQPYALPSTILAVVRKVAIEQ